MNGAPLVHVWPPERFFWALIDAPGAPAGSLPPGLAADLQDELPVPVDQLHAVCVPTPDGELLVCAARREELRAVASRSLSLQPTGLPAFAAHCRAPHGQLELLVGEFEPLALRHERVRRTLLAAVSLVLCSLILSLGIYRRTETLFSQSQAASLAVVACLDQVEPGSTLVSLEKQLERAQAAAGSQPAPEATDAGETLASLLAVWPAHVECDISSISISPTTMVVALAVADDARPFLEAVRAPDGWRLDEPRIHYTGSATRVSLTFRHHPGG